MPIDEFWYGEDELLNAYIKAYFNKEKYSAWIKGYYTYVAQLTASSNTWGGDKGKKVEYPPFDLLDDKHKSITEKKVSTDINDYSLLSQLY